MWCVCGVCEGVCVCVDNNIAIDMQKNVTVVIKEIRN